MCLCLMSKRKVIRVNRTLRPLEPFAVEPTEEFRAALLSELKYIERKKSETGRIPTYTIQMELKRHIAHTLNSLYKDGKIDVGDALNDKYILTR